MAVFFYKPTFVNQPVHKAAHICEVYVHYRENLRGRLTYYV